MLLLFFTFIFGAKAQSFENLQLIINNKIIEDVGHCSQEEDELPQFYVSGTSAPREHPWYENLRGRASDEASSIGQIAIGSIVLASESTLSSINTGNYVYIEVERHSRYRSKLSRPMRGAVRGYLFGNSVDYPEQWQFKVDESLIEGLEDSGESSFLNNKLLISIKGDHGYHTIYCDSENGIEKYPVFGIFTENEDHPIGFIAARTGDFGFIKRLTPTRNRNGAFKNPLINPDARGLLTDPTQPTPSPHPHSGSPRVATETDEDPLVALPTDLAPRRSLTPRQRPEGLGRSAPAIALRPRLRPNDLRVASEFLGQLAFPLDRTPTKNFRTGIRRFRARRGQRLHAGCDLYRPIGDNVIAIASGEVIRVAGFAFGSDAIEVRNDDGSIYRYAEVKPFVDVGDRIEAGQKIAEIGRLRGLSKSMLHLEMYSGQRSGSLTILRHQPYWRRDDIVNPTESLVSLGRQHNFL